MKKVLIIDDEKDLSFFLKANLESDGQYKVIVANTGEEGLRAARRQRPDIIVLDIMMPGMDGLEVLRRVKEDESTMTIPVIMLTAKSDDESKAAALGYYNEDYLIKPVGVEALRSKIRDVLMRK